MRHSISNTAEYGDYHAGPRVITADTKKLWNKSWLIFNLVNSLDEFLADSKMVKNSLKNIVKQLLTIQSNQLVQNFAT